MATASVERRGMQPIVAAVLGVWASVLWVCGVLVSGDDAAPSTALLFVLLPFVAVLIVRADDRNVVGWALLAVALAQGTGTFGLSVGEEWAVGGSWARTGRVLASLGQIAYLVPAMTVMALLYFPDGRLPGSRWRPAVVAACAALAVLWSAMVLAPGPMDVNGIDNPLGVAALEEETGLAFSAASVVLGICVVAAVASLVQRYRRGTDELRRQVRWPLAVGAVLVAGSVAVTALPDDRAESAATTLWIGVAVLWPASVGVAVLRHRLYWVSERDRRLLSTVLLWVMVTTAFVAAADAFGALDDGAIPVAVSLGTTLAVATIFHPTEVRLRRFTDRWLLGGRRNDLELVSAFEQTDDGSSTLLERLAATAHSELGASWATVTVDGTVAAIAGIPDDAPVLAVPIQRAGATYATLHCGAKAFGTYDGRDVQLLTTLARQTAWTLHTAHLAGRLVQAQDRERQRIERNIHDGAQQELVAIAAKVNLARRQLAADPRRAASTLTEVSADAQSLLAGLRDLARGIHPTVLTDSGLVEAIHDRAARMPIPTRTVVADRVRDGRWAPEIEAAAYFVVAESLANVLKHAKARHATIEISGNEETIAVTIRDDGIGFDPSVCTGTGLPALADRLEALGATMEIESTPGCGTVVSACLRASRTSTATIRPADHSPATSTRT